MQLEHFNDIECYERIVKDYLLQHEATHCLMLGLCSQSNFREQPYLAVVIENNIVVGAAMRTSPHKLILSKFLSAEAIAVIARDLAARKETLPGIIAPQPEALAFAQIWQSFTGQSYRLGIAQRIYQLEVLQPITVADGYLRLANEGDRSLLVSWIQAFTEEVIDNQEPKPNYGQWCDRRLQQNSLYIWQNDRSVSMVGCSGSTPNGIRINPVYTPPEYRQRGYASSCVAALSQTLIDKGNKYCFLFTDLANPTSNGIYQKIGYQTMCDISNYWFES